MFLGGKGNKINHTRKEMRKMKEFKMITPNEICDECVNCKYYWENQDDEYMNCDGAEIPCHELILKKSVKKC